MTQTNHSLVDVKLTFAYLAEQPIIHTDETIGNISKLKQMRVIYKGKPVSVPALSGNSFRGQLRDIFADELCSSLSNHGKQRLMFKNENYAILYSGGALSEKSKAAELINKFAEHLASIRLMGSAFGTVMLPSKLAMTHIVPCAAETQEILQGMCGTPFEEGIVPPVCEWPSARDLIFNDGPLTRKDDSKDFTRQRFVELESQSDASNDTESQTSQQMIYHVECIPAGTWLLQQLYSKFPLDQLELGCLFDGLNTFLRQPALGGRSAAGYGQVRLQLCGTVGTETVAGQSPGTLKWPITIENAVCAYQSHMTRQRCAILKALDVKTEEAAE